MAVSRRLRFEILRRDGHTCRYCGAMAPDVPLTVDHVIPVALGGSDESTNLVTACDGCNSGKGSIAPDAPIVADVAANALRWRQAIEQARLEYEAERQMLAGFLTQFEEQWNNWTYSVQVQEPVERRDTGDPIADNWYEVMGFQGHHAEFVSFGDGVLTIRAQRGWTSEVRSRVKDYIPRLAELIGGPVDSFVIEHAPEVNPPPPQPSPTTRTERRRIPMDNNWRDSVTRFLAAGLTVDDLTRLTEIAMRANSRDTWRYFCGCSWREITDLQESARRIIESQEAE